MRPSPSWSGETLNLLVVEDDLEDFELLTNALEMGGMAQVRLRNVARLAAAVEACQQEDFDLVLLDLGLPDSTGLDTFIAFQHGPQTPPVVVLSGNRDREQAMAAVAAGAQDFLVKGNLDPELLVRSIRYAIGRHASDERHRLTEERFRLMADQAVVGMFLRKREDDGELLYTNRALEKLTDGDARTITHPEDGVGWNPEDRDRNALSALFEASQHGPASTLIAFGSVEARRWLEVHASPVALPGREVGIMGTVRDVTERHETANALRRALEVERRARANAELLDKVRTRFLQNISHELRTPLTVMLGFGHVLRDHRQRLTDEQVDRYLRSIINAGDRQRQGLDDMAQVSDLGSATIERSLCRLDQIIEGAVAASDLGERQVDVQVQQIEEVVDAAATSSMLGRLLDNIAKHTLPETRVRVSLDTSDPSTIRFVIEDSGAGIPQGRREVVFEPFEQGRASGGHASPGLGMGLTLVQQYAITHGGHARATTSDLGGVRLDVEIARTPVAYPDEPLHGEILVTRAPSSEQGAVAWASRRLIGAADVEEVVGIILRVVDNLGGSTVTAELAGDDAIPLDLSFGTGEPVLPRAPADSEARARLQRHLPPLVADARKAVDRLHDVRRLRQDAGTDPMTNLANRRSFDRLLTRLSDDDVLVLLDLDEFTPINDTHGHAAGDQTIQMFAACLREQLRAGDLAARLGGGEFALVLRGTTTQGAQEVLERLRDVWVTHRPYLASFSAGMSPWMGAGDVTMAAAGGSLYAVKTADLYEVVVT